MNYKSENLDNWKIEMIESECEYLFAAPLSTGSYNTFQKVLLFLCLN